MPLGAALKRALHPACRQRGGIEWGGSSLFGSSLDAFLAKSLLGQPFPGEALSLPSFLPFL